MTEYNTKCYAVTFRNKGWIKEQKIEDISDDKNFIYSVNPMKLFIVKSESCKLTALS